MKRTILITGASSGIGHAATTRLLKDGHSVIGVSRNTRDLDFEADKFSAFGCDFSDLNSLPEALSSILAKFPDIDGAVFCAGRGQFSSLEEFSLSQIRELMDLNFTSQAYLSHALIPDFKKRKFGDLIFMGSEAALQGSRKGSIYCASKFAIRGFTQALREECANSNVRVTLINAGMVKTEFFNHLKFTHGDHESNFICPTDIAELIATILNLRRGTLIDEINLSPLNKVIRFTT